MPRATLVLASGLVPALWQTPLWTMLAQAERTVRIRDVGRAGVRGVVAKLPAPTLKSRLRRTSGLGTIRQPLRGPAKQRSCSQGLGRRSTRRSGGTWRHTHTLIEGDPKSAAAIGAHGEFRTNFSNSGILFQAQ